MNETWKRWEGRTVDGRFPLQSYLGGSDHGAVFLTTRQTAAGDSEKAAIKLISSGTDSEKQLQRWKSARDLNHPDLIRMFDAGRCKLDGTKLLYVVEEYAEENLSQILPERALTAEEARGMLPPILRALDYVHSKGLVHGHIQPSNILAVGDQVKLSSDGLSASGGNGGASTTGAYAAPESASGTSAAGDVWQLGIALIEVLTQRLPVVRANEPEIPAAIPEPLREIAGRCLQGDPAKRCTIGDILERLGEKRPEARPAPASAPKATAPIAAAVLGPQNPSPQKVSAKWSYLVGLAAVLAIAFVFIPRPKPSSSSVAEVATPTQSAPGAPPTEAKPTTGADLHANPDTSNPDSQNGVVQRVLPEISQGARRSIHGTIQVRVRVKVDAAGNVEVVKPDSNRVSKYFKRAALDAARDWKFVPAPAGEMGSREWKLQFAFSRSKTDVSAARGKQ